MTNRLRDKVILEHNSTSPRMSIKLHGEEKELQEKYLFSSYCRIFKMIAPKDLDLENANYFPRNQIYVAKGDRRKYILQIMVDC